MALIYFRLALMSHKDMGNWEGVANCLNGLGTLRQRQGNLETALSLFQSCLDLRRGQLYGTHPDIAQVLTSLGSLYLDQHEHQRTGSIGGSGNNNWSGSGSGNRSADD